MTLLSNVHALVLIHNVIPLSFLDLSWVSSSTTHIFIFVNLSEGGKGLIFPDLSLPGPPLSLSKPMEVYNILRKGS